MLTFENVSKVCCKRKKEQQKIGMLDFKVNYECISQCKRKCSIISASALQAHMGLIVSPNPCLT